MENSQTENQKEKLVIDIIDSLLIIFDSKSLYENIEKAANGKREYYFSSPQVIGADSIYRYFLDFIYPNITKVRQAIYHSGPMGTYHIVNIPVQNIANERGQIIFKNTQLFTRSVESYIIGKRRNNHYSKTNLNDKVIEYYTNLNKLVILSNELVKCYFKEKEVTDEIKKSLELISNAYKTSEEYFKKISEFFK